MSAILAAVLPYLTIVVENLPGVIKTSEQLYAIGLKFYALIKGEQPTEEEKTQFRAELGSDVMTALLPLPAAQPGDPDYVKPTA